MTFEYLFKILPLLKSLRLELRDVTSADAAGMSPGVLPLCLHCVRIVCAIACTVCEMCTHPPQWHLFCLAVALNSIRPKLTSFSNNSIYWVLKKMQAELFA